MTEKKKAEAPKTPQEFFNKYQKLCEEYGFNITVIPSFKARDDGTWSIVLKSSIQPLRQDE